MPVAKKTTTKKTATSTPRRTAKNPGKKTAPAKKAPAKKTVKKAAPAERKERTKKEGLRKPQLRILEALSKSKSKNGLTRSEVSDKAGVDSATCTEYIGSANKEVREANDSKHFPSLVSLKLISANVLDEDGKDVIRYSITTVGKAKL